MDEPRSGPLRLEPTPSDVSWVSWSVSPPFPTPVLFPNTGPLFPPFLGTRKTITVSHEDSGRPFLTILLPHRLNRYLLSLLKSSISTHFSSGRSTVLVTFVSIRPLSNRVVDPRYSRVKPISHDSVTVQCLRNSRSGDPTSKTYVRF